MTMMNAGEAIVYLRGEAERDLREAEINLKLLSKAPALELLRKLKGEFYQLARNLRRNKTIPTRIPANLQICYDGVVDLHEAVGKKILSNQNTAEKEVVKRKLLADLEKVRVKIRTVENMLVQLEKEGKKSNQRLNA